MDYYSVQHTTIFDYSEPITESLMEVRMTPRTEDNQRLLRFQLSTKPQTQQNQYIDDLGNTVIHFNVQPRHHHLEIVAESTVEMAPLPVFPQQVSPETWDELDAMIERGELWDYTQPSTFAHSTELLLNLMKNLDIARRGDPLSLLHEVNGKICSTFKYVQNTTRADSPIDEALAQGSGVCQDFAHIMITVVRELGIPARYVSGYLFHGHDDHDRSAVDATHAWLEAYVPAVGWVGFDPTNCMSVCERHIRAAVGRDYADCPPTKGVFKGIATTELQVAVKVKHTDKVSNEEINVPRTGWTPPDRTLAQQQQQQQQ